MASTSSTTCDKTKSTVASGTLPASSLEVSDGFGLSPPGSDGFGLSPPGSDGNFCGRDRGTVLPISACPRGNECPSRPEECLSPPFRDSAGTRPDNCSAEHGDPSSSGRPGGASAGVG